ncbi:hypothetical protein VPHF99_0176 [Vibrio phage F99]
MSFKKEDKYFVISRKDVEQALDSEQKQILKYLADPCAENRYSRGKDVLKCVVVESNSMNYEKVWDMVEEEYEK